MNKLILLILSVGVFFIFIGCINRSRIEKIKSECNGYLMMLYSGCHCFKEFGNDSSDIISVDVEERYCHD